MPPNPERTNLPQETLVYRRVRFSRTLSLLVPAGSLPNAPLLLAVQLQRDQNAPLPLLRVRSFGDVLEPRYIVGPKPLDQ